MPDGSGMLTMPASGHWQCMGKQRRQHLLILGKAEEFHITGKEKQQTRDVRMCTHALHQTCDNPWLFKCQVSHLAHEIQCSSYPSSCDAVEKRWSVYMFMMQFLSDLWWCELRVNTRVVSGVVMIYTR